MKIYRLLTHSNNKSLKKVFNKHLNQNLSKLSPENSLFIVGFESEMNLVIFVSKMSNFVTIVKGLNSFFFILNEAAVQIQQSMTAYADMHCFKILVDVSLIIRRE